MYRQLQPGGRVGGDHRLRWPPLVSKGRLDPVGHGWNDRQAVGPAMVVAIIERSQKVVRHLVDAVGIEWHLTRTPGTSEPSSAFGFPPQAQRRKGDDDSIMPSRSFPQQSF